MMFIPDDAWISIIKYLDINDLVNICNEYNRLRTLCDKYPCHIYKEMLRVRGFRNFRYFTMDTFLKFCKIDSRLKLTAFNILYAYEIGYADVVRFLLDNVKKIDSNFLRLETNKIAESIHAYWSFHFKGIGYLLDESLQEELLMYFLDFNVNRVNNICIPDFIDRKYYRIQNIYSKVDFQSISCLVLHISVIKNEWDYVKDMLTTMDVIGMGYYEDAY